GTAAGQNNNTGGNNTFVGVLAGQSNTTEDNNTFIGANANGAAGITNATAIGAGAQATHSNSLVLGNNVNVGIGTTNPATQLHATGRITTGQDFSSAGAITFRPPDGYAYFHIDNGPAGGRPMGRLRFSAGVNPGDIEFMSILQGGNAGIGTTSP